MKSVLVRKQTVMHPLLVGMKINETLLESSLVKFIRNPRFLKYSVTQKKKNPISSDQSLK